MIVVKVFNFKTRVNPYLSVNKLSHTNKTTFVNHLSTSIAPELRYSRNYQSSKYSYGKVSRIILQDNENKNHNCSVHKNFCSLTCLGIPFKGYFFHVNKLNYCKLKKVKNEVGIPIDQTTHYKNFIWVVLYPLIKKPSCKLTSF